MDVDHALVIGGTGMLRSATVAIARRSRQLTAVARTQASLATLASLLTDGETGLRRRYQTLDWDLPERFIAGLRHLVEEVGYPTLVLARLHDMNLGLNVAEVVSTPETPCDFFQVIGSSAGSSEGGAQALRQQVEAVSNVRYFQVVLGFKRQAGASRWLTDDEIASGVLDAIATREARHVVGTVVPWDQRP